MIIKHGIRPGQILQRLGHRGATATVRGTCSEKGEVNASIKTSPQVFLKGWRRRKVGRAGKGRFIVKLPGLPVGGPYEITISVGAETVTVPDVSVGDVWVIAGQSNASGYGNLRTAPKPHPKVHAFFMDRHWGVAREPIHFFIDSPDPVHYERGGAVPLPKAERDRQRRTAMKGTGFGIFFGREMVKRSGGVPQGLLCTAQGGTSMEQWDPAKKKLGGRSLYGSMLRTVRETGQPVAGVLWYQGENETFDTAAPWYTPRMKNFIAALRRDLKQPTLPFLMVQLARFFGPAYGRNPKPWNSVQDQQLRLQKSIRNCAVVSAVDLPVDDEIHIGTEGHARLGVRLARLADRLVYGNRQELLPPELHSISTRFTSETKGLCAFPIELKFKNVVGALKAAGRPTGFAITDKNHHDRRAIYKTSLNGNRVILETNLRGKTDEFYLMHGHGRLPYVNITDDRDMPIPVFGIALDPSRREIPIPALSAPRLAFSPYIHRWMVSTVQPAKTPVVQQRSPKPSSHFRLERQEFESAFPGSLVQQRRAGKVKKGQSYFFSEIDLSEAMKLNLHLGYDAPIKVWIDDAPIFSDPNGTVPATPPDKGIAPVSLSRGKHRIAVAMDFHQGFAGNFFLRFERLGLSPKRIDRGSYAVPVCSL